MKRKDNNGAGVSSLAQSEEVGLLLVFSITITSMGVILMMGVPALNDAKENAQIQRVETEFGSLDRQISSAAFGGGQTQARVNIQQGDFNFEPDAGWINISYYNGSDTIWENKSLPSITYTHVDSMISYQGGGIWTKYGDGTSTMSSPPDINLRGNTLNIALINITSGGFQTAGATDLFTFTNNGSHRMDAFRDLGPLNVGSMNLTIHSQHYRGWARYLNETGWPDVKIYSTNNTVHAKNPTGSPPFGQALLSSGNVVDIRGNSVVDAYDSRWGNYSPSMRFGNADIMASEQILIGQGSGDPQIYGSLFTENMAIQVNGGMVQGDASSNTGITIGADGCITGELEAPTAGLSNGNATCPATLVPNPTPGVDVPNHPPISDVIDDRVSQYSSSGTHLTHSQTTVTAGNYYVDSGSNIRNAMSSNWKGTTITFDTTDGPINIGIVPGSNADFGIGDSVIEITGNNPVRIFRHETSSNQAFVLKNVEMRVKDNRTDLFQAYIHHSNNKNTKVQIEDGTEFYGVVYAPNNQNIDLGQSGGAEIFGSVIAERVRMWDTEFHYDAALTELNLPAVSQRISYLHATDNRIGAR